MGRLTRHTAAVVAGLLLAAGGSEVRAAWRDRGPSPAERSVSLRLALEDLRQTFGSRYPGADGYLARLAELDRKLAAAKGAEAAAVEAALVALQQEALLANPVLAFDRLLLVRRADKGKLGLPQNWQGNCAVDRRGYDNEIAVLAPVRPDGKLTTLYRPPEGEFVGDVDLRFAGDRLLFSMPKPGKGRADWHVWEMGADGSGLRQVTPDLESVDQYDACYLPNGRILFDSTAGMQGVPCVGGKTHVANLYLMDTDGRTIRQLCYDQEHNWCPVVMNDGRVMYSRWEYTDTPHYFTRLLFAMNPDGTGQMALSKSNSYWPNATFYARPIPGHPSRIIAVISGHHGLPRMGELILFDVAQGRYEAGGVVQRLPGRGEPVEPLVRDGLVNNSWPLFLHPYPLHDPQTGGGAGKYFLVACRPRPADGWGVYVVDVFDNLVPVYTAAGQALLEPLPFRPAVVPPVIPDRVQLGATNAVVYMADVYVGKGLAGVPRGTVKALRVFEYHFAYQGMGGHISIGVDGPWDVHRIHGTVPVYPDGSAHFSVPANTPLAVQPLDAEGRAIQVMRSWFTAQPGERLSCVGCHESPTEAAPPRVTQAARAAPSPIQPWRGPRRGFSFVREVQPVLDKYCVGCHSGAERADKRALPNFSALQAAGQAGGRRPGGFDAAYLALHPYVRRPGPESDYHVPNPYEYAVDTSELVQLLRKGHHGVQLDAEAWDRLYTWIDLNVPDHGTWGEHRPVPVKQVELRAAYRKQYANVTEDLENYPLPAPAPVAFVAPAPRPVAQPVAAVQVEGWPFAAAEAARRQQAAGDPAELTLDLGENVTLVVRRVPAGAFIMGDAAGCADEQPPARVELAKPFYIARCETSNRQFKRFAPQHASGVLSAFNKDMGSRGEPMEQPDQPVARVSWTEAQAFCAWLSQLTGRRCALPTEAQWEWACRAGSDAPLAYGGVDADFSKLANLADARLVTLCRRDSPKWLPHIPGVNDGHVGPAGVGAYAANAWGLQNMHGNVAEWTRSAYAAYPYRADDGREGDAPALQKVVRGGSFYDRPSRARSAFRLAYPADWRVFNVGFRIVVEE